ncbi:MAG: Rpn family recombination-promoting nuclease/putative transposase [Bacteroidales bacterium]|jgi:predicted transposase/invertase (TIGR01784 family)|nr:Rpn family recombination-promoting nuclease/putative transposase [Bacteroidales bacterium]
MNNDRLNPLNDYLFMKYMGEKGDEDQLLAFLNVVLQKTGKNGIASVEIIESRMLSAAIIGDKASILDIRAVMENGTKVNIEVQLRNVGNMDKRSLFYWCREYVQGIEAGQDYRELPGVIAINIIDFEFMEINEVHTSFHLWEDLHKDCLLTNDLEIHFINMVNFRRLREKDIEHNSFHRWLAFFDKNTNQQTLKKIIKMDAAIEKAQKKIAHVSQDKEALRVYRMREMALSDFTSGVNAARREGEQRGIAIGEQRGEQRGIAIGEQRGITIGEQRGITIGEQKKTAMFVAKLNRKGLSVEEISDLTDLPVEEVVKILKEQEQHK